MLMQAVYQDSYLDGRILQHHAETRILGVKSEVIAVGNQISIQ